MSQLKLFEKFDWSNLGTKILTYALQLFLISLLFYFVNLFGQKLINKGMAHYAKLGQSSINRSQTLKALLKNVLRYTLMLFYIYTILSLFGIPVGTLVASAGLASLAIGLGAQGFVNDIVTGFFILFEQQLQVDDVVTIAGINGKVVAVGMRTTELRGNDGTLHYIPNRNITVVSNFSRGQRKQLINLRIGADTDLNKLITILTPINSRLFQEQADILSEPLLLGSNLTTNNDLVFQIQFESKQGAEIAMQRLLLDHYLPALQDQGIHMPTTVIDLQARSN